jgi:hypothetical protein
MTALSALRAGLLAGMFVFVAACGATPPAAPGQTPGQTPGQQPPAQTPGQQPPAGGGHDLQDPCGLITLQELSAAAGVDVVTGEETIGDPTTYCNYQLADGTLVLATSYSREEVNRSVYQSWAMNDDAIEISGIADGALYAGGIFHVLAGDAYVAIQPMPSAIERVRQRDDPEFELSQQDLIAFLTQLAQAVAGRL